MPSPPPSVVPRAFAVAVCAGLLAAVPSAPAAEVLDYDRAATTIYETDFGLAADRDFDRMPDGWSRRRGSEFPFYVGAEIERGVGRSPGGAFAFRPDGGPAAVYGPIVRVDDHRSHVLEAYVRTEGLRHNAVVLSVSALDGARRRIGRELSVAVTGTHAEWQLVRVGPLKPVEGQVFLVVGCHLVDRGENDLSGVALIDDVRLGRLPRLELSSNYHAHFRQARVPVNVLATVDGLESARDYVLEISITDGDGQYESKTVRSLEPPGEAAAGEGSAEPVPIDWEVEPLDSGFYEVTASLSDGEGPLLTESTSFAVMDLRPVEAGGRFGWSLAEMPPIAPEDLARIAAQAGVSRVKMPVWREAAGDLKAITRVARQCEAFEAFEIEPVGLLSAPPDELRDLFARDWEGASEVFALDGDLWGPTIEPVVARFSSYIGSWQLGTDRDPGFTGSRLLRPILGRLREEFAKVGRDARIGLPWSLGAERPVPPAGMRLFLTEAVPDGAGERVARESFRGDGRPDVSRWVTVRGERDLGSDVAGERASRLVRRLIDAAISRAEAIDLDDVFDGERGLLRDDGSPTELFLPYRATTWALREAEYLGQMTLTGGSENHVFVRPESATMIVWNADRRTESVYLGAEIEQIDMQGRRRPVAVDLATGRQVFDVGPEPLILTGASAPVARWRGAVAFDDDRIGGRRTAVTLMLRNTFPQGVNGTVEVVPPEGWELERSRFEFSAGASDQVAIPMVISVPPNASSGPQPLELRFTVSAERTHRFAVRRTLEVGSRALQLMVTDRRMPNGRLEITQTIVNEIAPETTLDFDCRLFVPGQKRRRTRVTRLGRGKDTKIYTLPDADRLRGETLWIRAEEENGSRVLNYRWVVGEGWE